MAFAGSVPFNKTMSYYMFSVPQKKEETKNRVSYVIFLYPPRYFPFDFLVVNAFSPIDLSPPKIGNDERWNIRILGRRVPKRNRTKNKIRCAEYTWTARARSMHRRDGR
jgi:hypothetical protein